MDDQTHDETFHFTCDPHAPLSARRVVARVLRRRGWHEHDVERAQLAASELVTNAVVHAQTDGTLRLQVGGPAVRLEVSDAAPASPPLPRDTDVRQVGGLGLPLVAAVSRAWGVDRRASAKAVWCELVAAFPFHSAAGRQAGGLPGPSARSVRYA